MPPIAVEKLQSLVNQAFDSALDHAKAYDHDETLRWNTAIINNLTASLVSEVGPASYKWIVNSIIIQHSSYGKNEPGHSTGMHSASGAYWGDGDGTWTCTLAGADARDFDVIITISWIDIQ